MVVVSPQQPAPHPAAPPRRSGIRSAQLRRPGISGRRRGARVVACGGLVRGAAAARRRHSPAVGGGHPLPRPRATGAAAWWRRWRGRVLQPTGDGHAAMPADPGGPVERREGHGASPPPLPRACRSILRISGPFLFDTHPPGFGPHKPRRLKSASARPSRALPHFCRF